MLTNYENMTYNMYPLLEAFRYIIFCSQNNYRLQFDNITEFYIRTLNESYIEHSNLKVIRPALLGS